MENAIKGLIVGALLGAFFGCVGYWLFTEEWMFPGNAIAVGALFCGCFGYLWGDDFFDALLEYWRHLF